MPTICMKLSHPARNAPAPPAGPTHQFSGRRARRPSGALRDSGGRRTRTGRPRPSGPSRALVRWLRGGVMATIYTECPSCGSEGKIDEALVGHKIKCKKCGNSFTLEVGGTYD